MPPAKPGDYFAVKLIMSPDTQAAVEYHAELQKRDPTSLDLPSGCRIDNLRASAYNRTKFWNAYDHPRYYVGNNYWRPMYGGLQFAIHLPWLDVTGMGPKTKTHRAIALFAQPEFSRLLMQNEATRKRSALFIEKIEGEWYAQIKYRDWGTGKGSRRAKPGQKTIRKAKALGIDFSGQRVWSEEPWYQKKRQEDMARLLSLARQDEDGTTGYIEQDGDIIPRVESGQG